MSITESIALAVKNIVSSKVRTLLTMLGIIIGVAAVIVIVGLGSGLEHYIADSFSSMGTNTLTVSVQARGATRTMEVEDMYQIVAEHPQELELCSPTVSMMSGVKIGSETTSTSASGVSEDYNHIYGYTIAQGRGLQYSDIAARAKVCVVGAYVNRAYFGGNAVGQTLRVGGQALTIVGVLEQREDSMEEGGLLHRRPPGGQQGFQLCGHHDGRGADDAEPSRAGAVVNRFLWQRRLLFHPYHVRTGGHHDGND